MANTRVKSLDLNQIVSKLLFFGIALLAYLVPFSLKGPQLLTGSLINALLIISAQKFSFKNTLWILPLPSLAVLSRGLIFGPLTIYLVYMLPLIWLGNLILIFSFNYFFKSSNYFLRLIVGAFLKSGLLFLGANLFFRLKLLPAMFLKTMGATQLATALIGGLLAWLFLKGVDNAQQ